MTTEKRLPWSKWYWGDWRKDVRLHRCGYAARGLWADMLSLMGNECDRFGYLILEGDRCEAPDLAGLFGGSEKEVTKLLAELESRRVFSRIGDADIPDDIKDAVATDLPVGTIFSRRMVRDKAKEERDRKNGKGGGNPSLVNNQQQGKPPDPTGGLTPPANPELTGGDKAQKLEARNQKETPIPPGDFETFWLAMPKRGGAPNPKGEAKKRYQRLLASGVDPAELLRAANGYAAYCRKSGAIDTDKVQQVTTFIGVKETWRQYAGDGPLLDGVGPSGGVSELSSTARAIIDEMRDRGDLPLTPAAKKIA